MDSAELQRLCQRILQRAHAYTADPNPPGRHHLVPRFHLQRWTIDGALRRTLVDNGRWRDLGVKGVGWQQDFYRLEADDLDPALTPPLFAEVLLGELENIAKPLIDTMLTFTPGPVRGSEMIADMSLFLAAQIVRGQAFRDEHLILIEWADNQDQVELSTRLARVLLAARAGGTPPSESLVVRLAESMRARTPMSADPKAQAIEMMLHIWLNLARFLADWKWAIYRTEAPLLTSDEPGTLIGKPGTDRGEKPGLLHTAAVVLPLSPNRLLVLFPPESSEPRYPYALDATETREINTEIMAFADSAVFEQPGTDIAASIDIPPRGPGSPLTDTDGAPAQRYRKPSRWAGSPNCPPPPVGRWHQPENPWSPTSMLGCRVLGCDHAAETAVALPEVADYVRANPRALNCDPHTPVCHNHRALLLASPADAPTYQVDRRWRDPQTGQRELRIIYPTS
ncbi:DUF4238 domain-containing protein [Nocardia xishanensis]